MRLVPLSTSMRVSSPEANETGVSLRSYVVKPGFHYVALAPVGPQLVRGWLEGLGGLRGEGQGGAARVEQAVRARRAGQPGPVAADPGAGTARPGQDRPVGLDRDELAVVT